jgi:hypothetical protein
MGSGGQLDLAPRQATRPLHRQLIAASFTRQGHFYRIDCLKQSKWDFAAWGNVLNRARGAFCGKTSSEMNETGDSSRCYWKRSFRLESGNGIVEILQRDADTLQDRHVPMKKSLRFLGLALLSTPLLGHAQVRPGSEFQLTKITKNLISSPQFTYTGAQQYPPNQRELWLEVEATFAAGPAFTDELTFKYFILFNGKLLTGEVTHTNIPAGRENRSVMYGSPRALARFNNNRPVTVNSVQNIAVQIVQQGAVKDELSLMRAPGQWYASLPATAGFLLNKNETPFAPLYWDRYEQVKTPAH